MFDAFKSGRQSYSYLLESSVKLGDILRDNDNIRAPGSEMFGN